MSRYLGETSVPGVVALLGEYGLGYGEPALALAIDHRVSVKANETDFDFYIVDDYIARCATDGPGIVLQVIGPDRVTVCAKFFPNVRSLTIFVSFEQ